MRATFTLLIGALALTLGLVACAPADEGSAPEETLPPVTVSGEFGRAPVVSFEAPLPLEEAEVETIIEGEGRELAADEPALLALTAFDGTDGEVLADRGAGEARTLLLTPEDVGEDLYPVLLGAREASRLLLTQPVSADGSERMLVLVIDVLNTRAAGEPVEPREDLPTVELDATGAPTIAIPDADPPPTLEVATLIRGTGPQVRPGQDVTVQYHAVAWPGGEVYDSTWADGKVPRTIPIAETFPGLRDGLVDQAVGSQVLLVVPPALAAGTQTLVLVVDILATSGEDGEVVVPSPARTD
ncbi:FKBP-type peptidyl-prolyl cis-trans isomerase [Georgenia wangjunii]|uniref:FKBP-type peptidyl-prolyl cis-trans isomerase n=1 Tax=Georgenia wangjunii TaxID=3117730 RepID=UPI002F267587